MQPKVEIVRFWLAKAESDLASARRLIREGTPLIDAGCLHCQQAVEKALKGFLQWHEVETPKTHLLSRLSSLVRRIDSTLADLIDEHDWLSPFASDVRYTPYPAALSIEVAERAVSAAERLSAAIVDRLPPEVRH